MSGLKKSKIYAYYLLDNQESGIFYTWNECEQKVKGKKPDTSLLRVRRKLRNG